MPPTRKKKKGPRDLRHKLATLQGAQSVLLVGDQQQLPPTVKTQQALRLGLGTSLFSRMCALGLQPHLLDMQYRMHPAISEFPSAAFYQERLRDAVKVESRQPPPWFLWRDARRPVAFISCTCASASMLHVPWHQRLGNCCAMQGQWCTACVVRTRALAALLCSFAIMSQNGQMQEGLGVV